MFPHNINMSAVINLLDGSKLLIRNSSFTEIETLVI